MYEDLQYEFISFKLDFYKKWAYIEQRFTSIDYTIDDIYTNQDAFVDQIAGLQTDLDL